MTALLKYWPILLFLTNLLLAWLCWTLRELAKAEVSMIVNSATTPIVADMTKLTAKVDDHHDKLGRHESQIEEIRDDIRGLPTKADLVKVETEIRAVGDRVGVANDGIRRLEGYFLKEGVEALR